MDWYSIKLAVVDHTDLGRDALHIFIGLAGQILVALIIRRTLAHPIPWIAVLIGELLNEYYDLGRGEFWDTPMWPGSVRDILVTMAVPTVLLLLTRYAPSLFARTKGKSA